MNEADTSAPSRFDRDTAVIARGNGVFDARIDRGWWVARGPNGGYVAAILVRALAGAVGDPARVARSLTVHYTAPPAEGPVRIETRLERTGRSLTTASARLTQDGRLLALALAAFSLPRRGYEFAEWRMPEVPPPEECPRFERLIEIHDRFEQRWALGTPAFGGGDRALSGGWIRLAEPRLLDAPLAAAYADTFPPAFFSRLASRDGTRGVPTIDLTVHFREALPLPGARTDDFALVVFRSRESREGFVEEDGEIWSPEGRLVAHSRQLALVL